MLRALIFPRPLSARAKRWRTGLLLLAWSASLVVPNTGAPQQGSDGIVEFAPGATQGLAPGIARLMDRAERDGIALGETLTIQGPMSLAPGHDVDALRDRAMADPRARDLLGLGPDPAGTGPETGSGDRWEGAALFLLVSFSMPDASLRQAMEDASAHGIPVVMRGFVGNSIPATREKLLAVFGSDEAMQGFSIDPTLFTRFRVTSVPTLIGVSTTLDLCETPGCADDPMPEHDRLAGNVRLVHALGIIANARDAISADAARAALARAPDLP